jgi:hypothetical protein
MWTQTQILADCLRTIGDGPGKLNLVQLSRSTQTVAGSLWSPRVYVNAIGDCLWRNYIPQCSATGKQDRRRSKHTEQRCNSLMLKAILMVVNNTSVNNTSVNSRRHLRHVCDCLRLNDFMWTRLCSSTAICSQLRTCHLNMRSRNSDFVCIFCVEDGFTASSQLLKSFES